MNVIVCCSPRLKVKGHLHYLIILILFSDNRSVYTKTTIKQCESRRWFHRISAGHQVLRETIAALSVCSFFYHWILGISMEGGVRKLINSTPEWSYTQLHTFLLINEGPGEKVIVKTPNSVPGIHHLIVTVVVKNNCPKTLLWLKQQNNWVIFAVLCSVGLKVFLW